MPSSSPELTDEAKGAIQAYVWKLAVLPTSAAAIIAFMLGFAINEVARGKAYTDSMQTFSKDINTATRDVERSRAFAEFSVKELEKLRELAVVQQREINDMLEKIKKLQTGNIESISQAIIANPELRNLLTRVNQGELSATRDELAKLKSDLAQIFQSYRTEINNVGPPINNTEPANNGGGYSPDQGPGRCPKGTFVVGIQPFKATSGIRAINFQCGALPSVDIK